MLINYLFFVFFQKLDSDLQRILAEEIAFYNKVKLSVSIDSLMCYYYRKKKLLGTESRESIYVKNSIVKHFGYQYQWLNGQHTDSDM